MPPHVVRGLKRQLVAQLDGLAQRREAGRRLIVGRFGFAGEELLPSFGQAATDVTCDPQVQKMRGL